MGSSDSRRKVLFLVILSVAVVVIVAGAGIWWFWLRPADTDGSLNPTQSILARWHLHVGRLTADEAAMAWDRFFEGFGDRIDLLSKEEQAEPYFSLANKYFGEGKYSQSFDAYQQALGHVGPRREEDGALIYWAGLAGKVDWLTEQLSLARESSDRCRVILIEGALAWTKRNYSEMLAKTSPDVWEVSNETPDHGECELWIRMIRAHAFMQQGKDRLAWDEITAPVRSTPRGPTYCLGHLLREGAKIAERTGNIGEALYYAQKARASLGHIDDPSWEERWAEVMLMIKRLHEKQRLQEAKHRD